jgi:hypothetical protein
MEGKGKIGWVLDLKRVVDVLGVPVPSHRPTSRNGSRVCPRALVSQECETNMKGPD